MPAAKQNIRKQFAVERMLLFFEDIYILGILLVEKKMKSNLQVVTRQILQKATLSY